MAEEHFSLLKEIEDDLDKHHIDAALRSLKALSAAPEAGESVRKLRRGAIELLAQLADLRDEQRAPGRDDRTLARAEQGIIADGLSLIEDARGLAHRGAFSKEALASARQVKETYALRREDAPKQKGSVFISYRRSDSADAAGRLYDRLSAAFGRDQIFIDVESIPLGIDYRVHIVNILTRCRACLVLIGDEWLTCRDDRGRRRLDLAVDPVRVEVETALRVGVPVVPLFLGGAVIPKPEQLPTALAQIHFNNGVPLRPNPDFDNDVERLIGRLRDFVWAG